MDSDFVVGINKSIDAAKGETGQTYPAYLHNTFVTEKLDELAGAISEGGGGASALADLTDVDISGSVQGGKVLKYNAVEEKWTPGDDSGNVQSDWNESDPTSGAYILNKPENVKNIYSSFDQPSIDIGNNGDIYLLLDTATSSETITIYYDHDYDGTTTTVRIEENGTEIYSNTVNNVQQGDLSPVYAGFDEVTANVVSLNGISFIFKYRGVAVNSSNPTCFFTSFNNGLETGWTMEEKSNSSHASHVSKEFNVPSGNIVSEIYLKNNNMWIPYTSSSSGSSTVVLTGTLDAGETTITISNAAITSNSIIIPCVDEAFIGVAPTAQVTALGSVTLTFPVQSTDMPMKVVVI